MIHCFFLGFNDRLVEQVRSPYVDKRDLGQWAHSQSNQQVNIYKYPKYSL